MLNTEAIAYIKNTLSAGNLVFLEVTDPAIQSLIDLSFLKCKPWFLEPILYETVNVVVGDNRSAYILNSSLSKTPKNIHNIYTTITTGFSGFDNDVSGLLSLEGKHLQTMDLIETSMAIQYERQTNKMLGTNLEWTLLPTKILISGALPEPRATVLYHKNPSSFEDVTHARAIQWILEYALNKVKYALGRSRSKFRGGDLNIDNDGVDLISEGQERTLALEEQLPNLDFLGEGSA